MSHIVNIQVELRDLIALKRAVKRLGFEWREGQKTFRWYGRWVGDSPRPQGMTPEEYGRCEHAIRVPGCSYEVGVVERNGNYELRYDFWREGGLEQEIGQRAAPIVQAYGIEKTLLEAELNGHTVTEQEELANGDVVLWVEAN